MTHRGGHSPPPATLLRVAPESNKVPATVTRYGSAALSAPGGPRARTWVRYRGLQRVSSLPCPRTGSRAVDRVSPRRRTTRPDPPACRNPNPRTLRASGPARGRKSGGKRH